MRIKQIISQYRRDFVADFECESCGNIVRQNGYDDANFHQNVIPTFICPKCGEKAPESYRPLTTKYPEGYEV